MSLTSDSFYVVLKSDEWEKNFPDNNSIDFRSKLLDQINFKYEWEVALYDIQVYKPKKEVTSHSIWVYCDIVVKTQIGDRYEPLLRRVPVLDNISKLWLMGDLQIPYYVKVNKSSLDSINIVIKEDATKHSQLLATLPARSKEDKGINWKPEKTTATTLTLHFRKIK